ncbi:receptor-transporting protein 1 isoform X2 [Papio anubis]|uniref:receptor-transporting protein 1 isoform X2 n=1 Tax=Papio anubis TaxID=9555 RepID=UPI00083EB10F|nr:receptor-transporting protein 1 isoform X2 [Papio anubis]
MSPSWFWGPPFFLSSLFYLSSLCSCCLATALSTQRDLIPDKRGKDSYALAGPEADCLGSRGHTSQEPPRPPGGALPPMAPPPGHWRPGGPLSSIPASHLLYLLEWDNFLSIPSSFGQIPSAAHACPHPEPFCSTLMVFSGSERPQNFWTNFDLQNMRERKRGFHLSSQHGLCRFEILIFKLTVPITEFWPVTGGHLFKLHSNKANTKLNSASFPTAFTAPKNPLSWEPRHDFSPAKEP